MDSGLDGVLRISGMSWCVAGKVTVPVLRPFRRLNPFIPLSLTQLVRCEAGWFTQALQIAVRRLREMVLPFSGGVVVIVGSVGSARLDEY